MSEPRRSEVPGGPVPALCRAVAEGAGGTCVASNEARSVRAATVDVRRAARVRRLERAVLDGAYRPDARAIAAALLRAMDAAAGEPGEAPPPQ